MLDVKSMLVRILDRLSATGTLYVKAWNITTSTEYGTPVTDPVSLPPGTYIVVITTPVASADFTIGFMGAYGRMPSYGGTFTQMIRLTQSSQVQATIGQTVSVTFTNTGRGSMRIVRIK